MLEIFVAAAVFGSVLTTFVPLLQSALRLQRTTELELLALREADNLLESLRQTPWQKLTDDELSKQSLSEIATERLPKAELKVTVVDAAEKPTSKQVTVAVTFFLRDGQPRRSIQLSSWFFAQEGQR